ncbi:hypothetical protein TRE132_57570 [Pseudomonas chlororaphis subsp. aurantiaca]|nr:hypothetical protein TRE132_57570 [Pseudomonas chlororaphis subsp. aurantiaca]
MQLKATQVAVEVSGVTIHPGDLIVGDASGCLVIPIDKAEEVIKRAIAVEKTERDIIASVSQGLSLAEARRLHRYDQPWLAAEAKTPSAA